MYYMGTTSPVLNAARTTPVRKETVISSRMGPAMMGVLVFHMDVGIPSPATARVLERPASSFFTSPTDWTTRLKGEEEVELVGQGH